MQDTDVLQLNFGLIKNDGGTACTKYTNTDAVIRVDLQMFIEELHSDIVIGVHS